MSIDCEMEDCVYWEDGECIDDEIEVGRHPESPLPVCFSYAKEKDEPK